VDHLIEEASASGRILGVRTLRWSGCNRRMDRSIFAYPTLAGAAFGNDDDWILAAMRRSLEKLREFDLDVKLVSYGVASRAIAHIAGDFGR
jgi:hypothetical protein